MDIGLAPVIRAGCPNMAALLLTCVDSVPALSGACLRSAIPRSSHIENDGTLRQIPPHRQRGGGQRRRRCRHGLAPARPCAMRARTTWSSSAPGVLERLLAVGGLGEQNPDAGLATQRDQHRQRRLLALLRPKPPAVRGQTLAHKMKIYSVLAPELKEPSGMTKSLPWVLLCMTRPPLGF